MNKTDVRLKALLNFSKKTIKEKRLRSLRYVVKELEKPRRIRREINVSKISQYGNENKIIIVPGKVLGAGKINKKLKVAALSFSQQAKTKIEEAGGKCLDIEEILKSNHKKENIQIIG